MVVSTVGFDKNKISDYIGHQERLDGDEDAGRLYWPSLTRLTTVKPPLSTVRYDYIRFSMGTTKTMIERVNEMELPLRTIVGVLILLSIAGLSKTDAGESCSKPGAFFVADRPHNRQNISRYYCVKSEYQDIRANESTEI